MGLKQGLEMRQVILHLSWKRGSYGNEGEAKPQEVMLEEVSCLFHFFLANISSLTTTWILAGKVQRPFCMVKEMRRRIYEIQPRRNWLLLTFTIGNQRGGSTARKNAMNLPSQPPVGSFLVLYFEIRFLSWLLRKLSNEWEQRGNLIE